MNKNALAAFLLLFASTAHAEAVWSSSAADFDTMKEKVFLFYVPRNGRDYIKSFTCGSTVQLRGDMAVLLCEGGPGEDWSMTLSREDGLSTFWFTQGRDGVVPFDSFVYGLWGSAEYVSAFYMESKVGGLTALEPIHTRIVDVAYPATSPALDPVVVSSPVLLSVDAPRAPVFNLTTGVLNLDAVTVGADTYAVGMQRVDAGTGALEFRVTSALKK